MVVAFQEAEQLIRQGRCRQAKSVVSNLPEPAYELALGWYTNEHKDYYYYLVRYVLDSVDYKVMYCGKAKAEKSIARYGQLLESLSRSRPTKIYIKGKPYEFIGPERLRPFRMSK